MLAVDSKIVKGFVKVALKSGDGDDNSYGDGFGYGDGAGFGDGTSYGQSYGDGNGNSWVLHYYRLDYNRVLIEPENSEGVQGG